MALVRDGLGDALEDQIIQYQKALHNLALSIDAARKSGQDAAADQLKVQFDNLQAEINRLVQQKFKQESPSPLALGFANIGETLATNVRNLALIATVGIGAALVLPALLTRRRR